MKQVAVGYEFYKEFKDNDLYYVDKTLMIKELLDNGSKVNLFTRPRRFGKTLALTMLKCFFETETDAAGNIIDNRKYFEGTKIMKEGRTYINHMGKYPVIFLTLKSAKQPNYEMAYEAMIDSICNEYARHLYVLTSPALTDEDKQLFREIYRRQASCQTYATSLYFLSSCLKKHHGNNCIILIDEYDVPVENAYFEGFYDEMISFLRSLFESAFKTNDYLKLAVITGCLRISKESIFTGLNNLEVISVLNCNYAECFGFTQEEINELLTYYHLTDKQEELKVWYDGYLLGDKEVYNPWSVINYIKTALDNSRAFPKPYWSNTSSNSIVRELVEKADDTVKGELEHLIAGGVIEKPVHEEVTYEDIYRSQNNLWNFLFFTGYLKKVDERFDNEDIFLRMTIPNAEIRYIYRNAIIEWFDNRIKSMNRQPLYDALCEGNCIKTEEVIKEILQESISYYDNSESELRRRIATRRVSEYYRVWYWIL